MSSQDKYNIDVVSRYGQPVPVIILAFCFHSSMLKRSGILLSSCRNLQCYYASSDAATTSVIRSSPAFPSASPHPQRRTYAIVSDGRSANQHPDLQWPELTSACAVPTPYQIFNQQKGSPYSKHRFYELVKLYHPDKHGVDTNDGLDFDTKLSRYRLIIAANDILSNPVKRSAYDTYGAGWNGRPDVLEPRDSRGESRGWAGPRGAQPERHVGGLGAVVQARCGGGAGAGVCVERGVRLADCGVCGGGGRGTAGARGPLLGAVFGADGYVACEDEPGLEGAEEGGARSGWESGGADS
ncbi:hypothetical protein EYC80_007729 [Monilinia laxa]|uniref:J domain-containing protein n=1 Tax=Monilinia laxa TaxID=61186 RepID=A0A5N6JWT4_MONLA|nr:hypothetical protein EYC80_007729 [Monilinia laxa]